MRTVWKFEVGPHDEWQEISIPKDARILRVGQQQPLRVNFWADVLTESPRVSRIFRVFCTGEEIPFTADYIGTTQALNGEILHLYELHKMHERVSS